MDDPSFLKGFRVLAVDDDRVFLYILERMLHCCKYEVTTCDRGEDALSILREDKNRFDIILCDLHMPEIDGIKLLEVIASEFDIPVVMMSIDASAEAVMKGVTRGACDFLVKPVCMEQLGVIWQHVLRRKQNGSSKSNVLGQIGGNINSRETLVNQSNYADNISRISGPKTENLMRRSDNLGEKQEVELEEEDPCEANLEYGANKAKKPRIIWTPELHQKFMQAVQQLGAEKAVPKKILESMQQMGVTDLTRENVASHLQKFRLYIRRNQDPHDQSGNSSPLLCPNSFDQSSSSPSCYQVQHSTHLNPTNIALALQEQRSFFNPIITTHSRQANNNLHGGVVSTNLGFGSNPNQHLPLIQQQVQMPPRVVNFQTPSNFQNAIPNGASFVNNSLVDASNSYAHHGQVITNNEFTSSRNIVGIASIHQYNNYSNDEVVTNINYVRNGNVYSPFVKEGGVSVQDSDSEPYLYGYDQDSAFFQET